jgi:NADH:ubiquinone oxidoreductase subunit 5 (subunit L)/multisubunit Na+/H+ antiporter MnhA subunit
VLGLVADRVGALLMTLTTLVGLIVQSFASRSLLGDPRARRFHVLALLLTAATTSVAVAATGSGLFVAWVVTSIVLAALIGHRAPWPPAVAARRRTRSSFLIGDLALLTAVIVTVATVGDIDLRAVGTDAVALNAEQIAGFSALTIVAVLLVIAGVARSALVPIHRWLPSTLAAPTPVSALLHAGVVNGAGVLLIRFSPIFGSSTAATTLAFALGMLTALVATAVMLVRTDVKGGLVWSTSGQMGFMVLQLGVGAFAAALFHIVGHALYKAAMFLGAGGAISAHQRQVQRPHLGKADASTLRSIPARVLVGGFAPLAAFALALVVIDPHLTAAARILIVVFGSLAVARAANGWMNSTPFSTVATIVTAVAGVLVGAFAYVGGITLFENFVADVVPYDVPAAVGPVWVAVTLGVIALAVGVIAFTRGPRGHDLRRRVYVWLLSTGAADPITPASGPDTLSVPRPQVNARAMSAAPAALTVGEPA